MSRTLMKTALLGFSLLCLSIGTPNAQTPSTVKVQLVLIMDGSGSINQDEFTLMITGIANSISDPDVVPQNGTVELGVVQFSSLVSDPTTNIAGATTEVPMTVVTQQTVETIVKRIKGIPQGGGFTPMISGIRLATGLVAGDNAKSGARQVFNIISDGNPNMPGGPEQAKTETIKERDKAVAAGVEQIDAEGIGDATVDVEFKDFLLQLVWPQPGVTAPPFPADRKNGFVILVKTFADLESALRQKLVATILDPPFADAGPIPDGKLDTEPYKCTAGQTITLDGSGSFDPNATNRKVAKYEWDFNGDDVPDATTDKPQFTCPDTLGITTIHLTVTGTGGLKNTTQQSVQVSEAPPPNNPPTAVCTSVISVIIGQTVQLDGSGSIDPEGKLLTYQWAFVSKPSDSQADFDNATISNPMFTVDKKGSYTTRLTVRDPEGATASCETTIEAHKPGEDIPGDELGAMKRELVAFGRTLNLLKSLDTLQLAANLLESYGATDRAFQIVQEVQLDIDELFVSLEDTRNLMAFIADGVEKTRIRLDALVAANTISTDRANRIHKSVDALSDFAEESEGRLDDVDSLINDALDILADIEDALSSSRSLSVAVDPEEMTITEMLRSARDKLLMAFAEWRAVLNGTIAHIDTISAQMRAALKLADRRKRFHLVRPEGIASFIELQSAEHRIQFAPSAMRWSVQNCSECSLKVEIYGLDGRRLVEQESLGPTLTLHWLRTPANGVYWYVLTVETPDGRTVRLLSKWVNLR